jgi:asparagine synthetase B (glutamine-hydrolysing)
MMERIKKENSYSSVVLPALESVRVARDRRAATWALFRAAIAIQRDGQQRLVSIKDPFGQGPFTYKKLPSGFRLSSKLKVHDNQVELTVGPTTNE